MSNKDNARRIPHGTHEISDSDSEIEDKPLTSSISKDASFSETLTYTACSSSQSSNPLPRHTSLKRKKDSSSSSSETKEDNRPLCKFGKTCYRKNAKHLRDFRHPDDDGENVQKESMHQPKKCRKENSRRNVLDILDEGHPWNFFLTTVAGIEAVYNDFQSLSISDILSDSMGELVSSAQFNYKIDISWLVQQYPTRFRNRPLLIVHGAQREERAALHEEAESFPNVRLCQAKLEIMFGTHHTKMMLLQYQTGVRVVIHTANLIDADWFQKTQGIWLSPIFKKLPDSQTGKSVGDSPSHFKLDLLEYLEAYRSPGLRDWIQILQQCDMSSANVYIIASVPGRHQNEKRHSFGHMKLRKVLQTNGPDLNAIRKANNIVGQFSSIGSLGSSKENWVCAEWLSSISRSKAEHGMQSLNLKLIFPSVENVRCSLEGYAAGGSLPYSVKTAQKQQWLHSFFHQWKADARGRSMASPHIKSYMRVAADWSSLDWFLLTSANLSKAAWGTLEKNSSQLMIRSYELGVLFIPNCFEMSEFPILKPDGSPSVGAFPVPFDLPPTPYASDDKPWMWDVPRMEKPDSHGTVWCPPL